MDDYSGNIDQQLLNAYLSTIYRIKKPAIDIKIGSQNLQLNEFLMDNSAFSWAIITAYNPYSQAQSVEINQNSQLRLSNYLKKQKLAYVESVNIDPFEKWPNEESYFIFDIYPNNAKEIALHFHQNAIICGRLGSEARLIDCNKA